jgi:L-methionine (R)-S-oxide reductase
METASNADDRAVLLAHFRESAATASSLRSLQTEIVESLAQRLGHYNWTGFYMLDPQDDQVLVLGPYFGSPTPHVRIPVSQGICGAAVASGQAVIVDDVSADPRYLSCLIETQSEIVVPIYVRGKVAGEIDIDSHDSAAFTRADRAFLEDVAALVGMFMEEHSDA